MEYDICNLIMFGFHEKVLDTWYRVCPVLYASSRFRFDLYLNWMVLDAPSFYKIWVYKILCAKIYILLFCVFYFYILWKYVLMIVILVNIFVSQYLVTIVYRFAWYHCSGHYLAQFLNSLISNCRAIFSDLTWRDLTCSGIM